jgi:hypothetical protein
VAATLVQDLRLLLESSRRTWERSRRRGAARRASVVEALSPQGPLPPRLRVCLPPAAEPRSTFAQVPRCSGWACTSAALYRVCVAVSVGYNEVVVRRLQLYACDEHRSDYVLAIQDRRIMAHFRRTSSDGVGAKANVRSLRAVFAPLATTAT